VGLNDVTLSLPKRFQGPNKPNLIRMANTLERAWNRAPRGSQQVAAKGSICFTFDDCHPQQIAVLNHMVDLGQRATIFANKDVLGDTFGYANTEFDLVMLKHYSDLGMEIGNHSLNHLDMTALSASTRATSLDTVNNELIAVGIPQPTTFGYPYGYRNVFTDRDLATRFRIFRYAGIMEFDARQAQGNFRIGGVRIISDSASVSGLGDSLVSDVRAMARKTLSHPVTYCFFNHLGSTYTEEATPEEFIDLLDYLYDLGIPCITMREAFGAMNMAPNPSFEDDANDSVGWPFELTSGPGSPTVSIATVTPYVGGEGDQALKLHTGNASDIAYKGYRQSVVAGERYWVSCRVYMENGPSTPSAYATDTFARSETDQWGTASGGGAWTRQTGTAADIDVASSVGTILTHPGETHYLTHPMDGDHPEVDITVAYTDSATPTDDVLQHSVFLKWVDTTHYLRAAFVSGAFGYGEVRLFFRNGGVETRVDAPTEPWFQSDGDVTNDSNNYYPNVPENDTDKRWVRVQCVDEWPAAGQTTIRMKWWLDSEEAEPGFWQYVYVDDTFSGTSGKVGLGNVGGASLAANITTSWDSFTVSKSQGTSGNGARLKVFVLGSNVGVLPDFIFDSPVETPQLDYNQSTWVQLATDYPITMPDIATAIEVRCHLEGISADAYFDHVVVGTEKGQPDGPLG
jgi:hypothetical protein